MTFDVTLPDPAEVGAGGVVKTVNDSRNNLLALLAWQVFLGMSPSLVTEDPQNADGSPATDPALPDQVVYALNSDANYKWKVVNTYDAGNGNRPDIAEYYSTINGGSSWTLLKTTTITYNDAGKISGIADS